MGIVYIARNESYPKDVYKVGMTERFDVEERMNELNQGSGTLGSFYAVKRYEVPDASKCERTIHQRLSKHRVQDDREFFKLPLKQLVKVVKDVCGDSTVEIKGGVRTEWKSQKRNGLHIEYHENGQKSLEVPIKDWRKDGVVIQWHEKGQKELRGNYKDGEKDELWTEWYENGQKRSKGNYTSGDLDGLWTSWYKDGRKELEGKWNRGKEEGPWTYWDENGPIRKTEFYKNGKITTLSSIKNFFLG